MKYLSNSVQVQNHLSKTTQDRMLRNSFVFCVKNNGPPSCLGTIGRFATFRLRAFFRSKRLFRFVGWCAWQVVRKGGALAFYSE